MRQLIRDRIAPVLSRRVDRSSSPSDELSDAANVGAIGGEVAFTTDSFVVSPLFFPGGDIGSLCIHGVVNDLAVSGAVPLWISLSFILEEGLPLVTLDRVLASIADAARRCDVAVVAGDTKVVPRGAADQLFVTTSAIGKIRSPALSGATAIRPNDILIVSGPIAKHGISVMAAREELNFDPPIQSDSAPVHEATAALQQALGKDLRSMRDATRGGVSAVLHEWAAASGTTMSLDESKVPVSADVRGACELLGLDPLYVANEGTFMAVIDADCESTALKTLHALDQFREAQVVGRVVEATIAPVVIRGMLGVIRPVDEPAGAPLPRIC